MDWIPINWKLVGNPANWAIVLLMLIIAGFTVHLLLPSVFPNNPVDAK